MYNKIILTCLFFLLPSCVLAAERSVNDANLAAYKELNQARTDALKESLQKDMQVQAARIDAQDKRVERQDKLLDSFSARISDMSFSLTVAGIILTLVGIVAGLLGYFTVSSRAKNEAREVAEEWVLQEGQKAIDAKFGDLDSHIAAQKMKFEKLYADAAAPLAERQQQLNAIQKSLDGPIHEQTSPIQSDSISLLVEALKHKPEAEYGFDDWNARAHDAYTKANLALAAEFWLQAARGGKGNGAQVAQALYNAGVALSQSNRITEAIEVYAEVVSRYGSAPEVALREQVARALVNKSRELAKLSRSDEAMSNYNDVVSRFGSAPESVLRRQALLALIGKANLLGSQKKHSEAIAVCDEVLTRYGNEQGPEFRVPTSHALNGKGFELLCRAKANWGDEAARLADLQAAYTLFSQAEKEIDNKPYVIGNQAYAAFLLGQIDVVRPLLKQSLQQGGVELYKATLGDLDIHPVPTDAEYRALLEEVWEEVKPKT